MELEKWFKDNKKGVKKYMMGKKQWYSSKKHFNTEMSYEQYKKTCKPKIGKVFGKAKRVKGVLDY